MAEFTLTGTSTINLPALDSGGVSRPMNAIGVQNRTIGGTLRTQITARKLSYSLSFGILTDAEYDTLLQFRDGRQGNGPFTLHDPRDASGVNHTVELALGTDGLSDGSQLKGYRFDVTMNLEEV